MTDFAAHFEGIGMTTTEAQSRAALFRELDERGSAVLNGPPEWYRFSPGRVEIFGKHTDYAGGQSLLAAVPRGIALVARPRSDGIVRVGDIRDGQVVEVDPSAEAPPEYRGLRRYVHVVARRFFLNFPGCELGAEIAIASDLPRASGLSSSSALVVGVASALITRAGLKHRDEWHRHLPTVQHLAWYLGCVENGLDYEGLPGAAGVGTHGGSEDHTAILACRLGHASLYRFVPVTALGEVPMPDDWTFVIASSGVQADKAGSVMARYNRASNAARALHAIWNQRAGAPAPSLSAAVTSAPDALARFDRWLDDGAAPFSPADLRRRLRHFVNEDARAPLAAQAFAAADRGALGDLSRASQLEAESLLGNQIPETVALANLAREVGAFASSSFGAGFGGSVWALTTARDAQAFAEEWTRAYERRMPGVGTVPWFIARPGPPATEITLP
ncbi:MAG: galactokinase family protein [Vicinamibacterales bacterium]|jgi:galactokinase